MENFNELFSKDLELFVEEAFLTTKDQHVIDYFFLVKMYRLKKHHILYIWGDISLKSSQRSV